MDENQKGVFKNKNKEQYTVIIQSIIRDNRTNLKEKGLLVCLLSLPNDWVYSEKGLSVAFGEGLSSVRSGIKTLIKLGYLKRKKIYKNGKVCGAEWEIFEKAEVKCEKLMLENVMLENKHNIILKEYNTNKINNILQNEVLRDEDDEKLDLVKKEDVNLETERSIVIPDLLRDKQNHIKIIGLFARAKGVLFKSKDEQVSFIKRNLRPARELVPYTVERIIEVMAWLKQNADFKWTIETVGKYIDEDLKDLEFKVKGEDDWFKNLK